MSRSHQKKPGFETTIKGGKEKEEEKELWSRLKTLNKDFKFINERNKLINELSKQY